MTTGLSGKRILVVDDDQQFAEVMHDFLTDEGYEVRVCLESDQAFALARSLSPDLVILDIRMPQLGGLGVLEHLGDDPRTRRIPVLMCSAVAAYEIPSWQEALTRRGVPVLFKPFDLDHLLAQVTALIAGHHPIGADEGDALADRATSK